MNPEHITTACSCRDGCRQSQEQGEAETQDTNPHERSMTVDCMNAQQANSNDTAQLVCCCNKGFKSGELQSCGDGNPEATWRVRDT